MTWTLEFESKARKALLDLDAVTQRRILTKLARLRSNPRGLDAIKLAGSECWRVRIGDYRIIYDIQDSKLCILVIKVGHRRDIYR